MDNLYKAHVSEVCASPYGYAIFISVKTKSFVIYVDKSRGKAMKYAFDGVCSDRPFTHEFVTQMLDGLDCTVKSVVIYRVDEGVFFTRINIEMNNELGKKLVEVDARPSDTLAIAIRTQAPIYVTSEVVDSVADVSDALKKIRGGGEMD